MPKIFSIIIACCIWTQTSFGQSWFLDKHYTDNKKVLLLMHPTVANIENFLWLIDNDIIELDNARFVGVFYKNERYDYSKSVQYLVDNQIENYDLQAIDGELTLNQLFKKNELSGQFEKLFRASTGILFFGGPDIPPAIYNEKTSLYTRIEDPNRHYMEASFLFHLLGGYQDKSFVPFLEQNQDYIVWAFCLGMQTMNVATGGTLVQDIPSELYNIFTSEDAQSQDANKIHKNYFKTLTYNEDMTGGKLHQIQFDEKSIFNTVLGYNTNNHPLVYSYHHQCVDSLGKNLVPQAYSMDGKIIESLRHRSFKNVLAFQFHPEKFSLYDSSIFYTFYSDDTTKISFYNLIENSESKSFNRDLWKYFSKIFNQQPNN